PPRAEGHGREGRRRGGAGDRARAAQDRRRRHEPRRGAVEADEGRRPRARSRGRRDHRQGDRHRRPGRRARRRVLPQRGHLARSRASDSPVGGPHARDARRARRGRAPRLRANDGRRLMAIVSFVPLLVTTVQQYFTAQGITAKVDFGRKARDKVVNQGPGGANRVVFMPGDPGGSAGKISGARQNVGQNPRPILTWEKLLTVSVWAVDTSDPANELLQFAAVEALFEATVAAIRSCAHADGRIGDPKWTTPPIEN